MNAGKFADLPAYVNSPEGMAMLGRLSPDELKGFMGILNYFQTELLFAMQQEKEREQQQEQERTKKRMKESAQKAEAGNKKVNKSDLNHQQ